MNVPRSLFLLLVLCSPVSRADMNPVVSRTLPTGVRLLVRVEEDSPYVAACVFVRAGQAEEDNPGVGLLTSRALFGSNENQSADAVNRAIFAAGGSLEAQFSPDYTAITCVTTREAFADAFYQIAQALKHAEFDPETLARARREAVEMAEREEKDPFRAAYAELRRLMYGDHPYARPIGGTPEAIRRLTRRSVEQFYRKRYVPAGTVVSICGNIPVEQAVRTIENQLLPDFDRPAARSSTPALPSPIPDDARRIAHLPVHTTTVLLGFQAPALVDPDYPAFTVLNAMLGGGKSARLFRAVRDTGGVGYGVGTYTPSLAQPGHLVAFTEYDPTRTDAGDRQLTLTEVEMLLKEAVRSIIMQPPTELELARAKRLVTGAHLLAHQRARERAFYTGWYEIIGMGYRFDEEFPDRVSRVSLEEVAKVARKYLGRNAVSVVEPKP